MEKTILVVSDHLVFQDGFRQCLGNSLIAAKAIQAYNAGQAVHRAVECHPDLILIGDLILAGQFPYVLQASQSCLRGVGLALLDFFTRREEELGLPRSAKAFITCQGPALAREMETSGLRSACDHVFEVPCQGFMETVQTLLESTVVTATGPAQPIQRCVTPPLAPVAVLPVSIGPFMARKKRFGQARKRQQSCVVELLEANCRKRG